MDMEMSLGVAVLLTFAAGIGTLFLVLLAGAVGARITDYVPDARSVKMATDPDARVIKVQPPVE